MDVPWPGWFSKADARKARMIPFQSLPDGGLIAIIDIGSNSIRLVVYQGISRAPVPIFNEKAVCALGEGLEGAGRLNPKGVEQAMLALSRFVRLARSMRVATLDVVATAAVRDAADAPDFLAAVHAHCGIEVTVLSGEEEARLAAQGVLCGVPDADGTVADLGGGSLELIAVDEGRMSGAFATLPLGVLRLMEASGGDRERAQTLIDRHFSRVSWLRHRMGRPLYAVGGAWRALARLFVAQTGHSLQVLDNYALDCADALRLLELVSRQSRKSIERIPGFSRKRLPHLPMAALALERILFGLKPSRLIFSVYGMREGRFFCHLPEELKMQDPLISACTALAATMGRFPVHCGEISAWMSPLIGEETSHQARLRHAATLLSDVFWGEHPDYRAEQAFLRVFRLPFMGLGHQDRAFLALAVYYRYERDFQAPQVASALDLLPEEEQRRALILGLALRLAHAISGGVPGWVGRTRLKIEDNALILEMPADDAVYDGDFSERRNDRLAKAAGLSHFESRRV